MARIEMDSEFIYTLEIPDERLKKLQEQWSTEEICSFLTTIINAQLVKSFSSEQAIGFAELIPNTQELFINSRWVYRDLT